MTVTGKEGPGCRQKPPAPSRAPSQRAGREVLGSSSAAAQAQPEETGLEAEKQELNQSLQYGVQA